MKIIAANRLPNVLETHPTRKELPPDNRVYKNQIDHYLPVFYLKDPGIAAAVLYRVLSGLFRKIWEELYSDKENAGELGKVDLLWWEAHGHRFVDAEYYLRNWETHYAALAENWKQIEGDPENIKKITHSIKMGIAGLLYVREYEDTVFATLKYHQQTYQRLDRWIFWGKPVSKGHDKYKELVEDINRYISSFPYRVAIDFLGELSGAYILSCPINYVKSDWSFREASQYNKSYSAEECCAMVLLKYICAYGSQEFAMDLASLPLQYIKKPNEEWKYLVAIPKTS
jgi:hypothetical protein